MSVSSHYMKQCWLAINWALGITFRGRFILNTILFFQDKSFDSDICQIASSLAYKCYAWWRRQMETFSALLAICAENSPVTAQRPVTRSFDVFFDLHLNKRLSKRSRGWWFETPSCPLWRHCNGYRAHDDATTCELFCFTGPFLRKSSYPHGFPHWRPAARACIFSLMLAQTNLWKTSRVTAWPKRTVAPAHVKYL